MKEKKVKRFLAIGMSIIISSMLLLNNSVTINSTANATAVHKQCMTLHNFNNDTTKQMIGKQHNIDVINDNQKIIRDSLKRDSLRMRLIDDVQFHIRKNFKIYDANIPMYLVDYSLKYDIDLCFMMAQTTIETGFGTTGAGRPTSRHSLFGVCKRYSNYDSAIEDYCIILKRSYLGSSRTEHDLMKNYVTLRGARYASYRRYEIELSSTYKKIRNNTQIYETWNELRNLNS